MGALFPFFNPNANFNLVPTSFDKFDKDLLRSSRIERSVRHSVNHRPSENRAKKFFLDFLPTRIRELVVKELVVPFRKATVDKIFETDTCPPESARCFLVHLALLFFVS